MKKTVSVFLTVLIVLFGAAPVWAAQQEYTIPEIDNMTIEVPEDLYVFTQDLDPTDPNLVAAGYLDIISKGNEMKDNDIYLDITGDNGEPHVIIAKKETSRTQEVYNLSLLSDEQFEDFLDEMRSDEESQESQDNVTAQKVEYKVERYDAPNQPFFVLDLTMESTDQMGNPIEISEVCYSTIINGYSITIDTYNENGPVSEQARALAKSIVDSAQFPVIQEKPEQTENTTGGTVLAVLIMLTPFLLVCLVIAVPIIVSRMKAKKSKRERAVMADKLETYRKEQIEKERLAAERGVQPKEPETRFANVTQYSDTAIRKFCMYHCFHKRVRSVILYFVCGLFCLGVGIFTPGMDWIMRVLMVLFFAFCIVWPLYLPRRIVSRQIEIYNKYRSRTALDYFRDEDFRVSELQSASVYPYFQITSVRESKEYFYLYFNDDQVYYVRKDGFKFGTADEFGKFIRSKV